MAGLEDFEEGHVGIIGLGTEGESHCFQEKSDAHSNSCIGVQCLAAKEQKSLGKSRN